MSRPLPGQESLVGLCFSVLDIGRVGERSLLTPLCIARTPSELSKGWSTLSATVWL